MSDKKSAVNEAAFIETIQNDPEDEASRLVYADWLEERGDERAEYLRLEAQYHRIRPRIDVLSNTLDKEWLKSVSRTYAVVFVRLTSPNKIQAIKLVREVTGFGLKDAKDLVEMPTAVLIRDGVDMLEADRMKKLFEDIAEVSIMPSLHAATVARLPSSSW